MLLGEIIMKNLKSRFNYSWVVIGISALMVLIVLGFCSSAKSIYIAPICTALGISRSAFSINDSCRFITTAIINIFFGTLIAKFGAKKLILAGFTSLITSMLIYAESTNVFGFYIGGVFLGIGLAWTTTTMVGSVVNKWCKKNKGTIMGAILASNGIGAAIAMQVLTPIIHQEGTLFGYRDSYRLVAVILFAVALIMLIFFRNQPKNAECTEDAKRSEETADKEAQSAIFKKGYFYVGCVGIFFTGMILQGVTGIAAPLMGDVGIDESYVATVLSLHALILTASKFSTGFLYDRVGIKKTSMICFVASLFTMVFLLGASSSGVGRWSAMAYGVVSPFALPLETVMLPLYAREFAGENNFNKALGVFASVNTTGYAVGAPVANLCYDITKSYNLMIYMCCILIAVTAIAMQMAITKAHKDAGKA